MLFYETFGSTSLKNPNPLVFLHGFLGSRLDWMPIIEKLQKDSCCIAVDLPSHGKSTPSKNVFKNLENTLLTLSSPPILIGYSLGGRLAFFYGQKHPEKIRGLIAISAHTGLKTALEKKKRKATDLIWKQRLLTLSSQEFLTLWYQQGVFSSLQKRPKFLQELIETRQYQNPKELADVLDQVSLAKQPLFESFSHPTYFLFGEEDEAYSNLYKSKPPHLTKVIKKAGHAAHIENPSACIKSIELFSLNK